MLRALQNRRRKIVKELARIDRQMAKTRERLARIEQRLAALTPGKHQAA
jgi:hypothetical protein